MTLNCSNDSESVAELFRQLEDKYNTSMIPAVVMLVLFSVVGLAGNILVLVVYLKKVRLNPTKVLIMTIASFDLVANVGAIPCEIIIILDTWTFSLPGVCKLKVFLGSFTTVGGAISLCVVAAIRYRKVCRPYGWQFTVKHAIIASITAAFASFIIAIPYIMLYGIRTRKTPCPGIDGQECFVSNDYTIYGKHWPTLNNALFVSIYLTLSVSMIVLYRFIGVTAYKHNKCHGSSLQITTAQKNINATPKGVASSGNEPIVPTETQVKPPPMSFSSRVKSGNFPPAGISILDCCKGSREIENPEQETPSSLNVKNNSSSSDTGTEDRTTQSTNSDVDAADTGEQEAARAGADVSIAMVCLNPTVLPVESTDEVIQRIEATRSSLQDSAISSNLAASEDHKHVSENVGISTKDFHQKNTSGTNKKTSKSKTPAKKVARRRPLGRMTAMLIIISAIFVLGYLPFLALTALKTARPEMYDTLNMAELMTFNFFYRLYFLNSAVNPIVYSLCDVNFRRDSFMLLTCRSRWRS